MRSAEFCAPHEKPWVIYLIVSSSSPALTDWPPLTKTSGMAVGEMNKINIEDGKTLMIKYIGLGDRNDDGTRNVQFELNGMRREVSVPDPTATDSAKTVVMADPNDKSQAGASIPGMVSKVNVKPGDQVKVNDVLAVIEAMKMETSAAMPLKNTWLPMRMM